MEGRSVPMETETDVPADLEAERAEEEPAAEPDGRLKAERVQAELAVDATERLKAERVQDLLKETVGWRASADSRTILRRFKFPALRPAVAFTAMVAELAATLFHQPEVSLLGNDVLVTFSTPSAGGVTLRDFEMAWAISLLPQPQL
jgi:4a-hydroxytetrahydrobiopterin dehydratase